MALYKYLECIFSDAEMTDKAKELAASNRKLAAIDQRKREMAADLKAKAEEQNSVIARLSEQIAQGKEFRDVECRVELDTPQPGMKTTVRLDTGEIVSVDRMTDEDRQLALDLEAKAEADKWANVPVIPEARRLDAPGPVEGDGFTIIDAEPEEKQ